MSSKDLLFTQKSFLIDIEGMKCGGCVRSVEQTLINHPNVLAANVNLVSKTALIDLETADPGIDEILKALTDRGFPARERVASEFTEKLDNEGWWEQWRQLMVALTLLLFSVLGHLAEGGQLNLAIVGRLPFHAALATVALFGPGFPILKRGFKATLKLSPTMDTLVGLGVSSAYLASLISLVWPEVGWPCFFNEPVMLLGFVLLGRFLEDRARCRTNLALKQLAKLQPDKARLVLENGEIREVRVGALKPGEKVQLLAGDRIPVDGCVIEGNSAIDISGITGEPLPLEASPGTNVTSGSLNLESNLIIEVQQVGVKTALARIIKLVEEAQTRQAPIQRLADRVAGNFCYGVVTLSIATFVFWWKLGTKLWPEVLNVSGQGLMHNHIHNLHSPLGSNAETPLGLAIQLSIAVLVVACPCALGLATPTVVTVASGQAAKKGWLFRGGDVIEKASSLKQIIFDKTGTLTIGRPLVINIFGTKNQDHLLKLSASLETNSRHPIAHAVLQEAQKRGVTPLEASNTKTYPGLGLEGNVEGIAETVLVGNPEWLQSKGIGFSKSIQSKLKESINLGHTIIAVAEGKNLLGILLIDDKLRPGIDVTLNRLRKQGIKLLILSGDRKEAVIRIGQKLGFQEKEIGWKLLPDEKLKKLKLIKEKGNVAMVGDGINDAPALAESDLGIAVGTGTQIAQETSDLVLLGDRLESLPEALLLSRRTMNKIKQNLIWAFGYNLIALPIAAGIMLPKFSLLLSPPIAALLMAISSITVVLNALSLKAT